MIPGLKSFESTIFLLAIILWILSEYIGASIIPYLRRHGSKIKKEDKGSRLLLSLGLYISVIIAFYFAFNNIGALPSWTFYSGIFLIILGIFIRQWSIFTSNTQSSNIIVFGQGILPVIADMLAWIGVLTTAQIIMWLIAGPSKADSLARESNKKY
jgi:uncharacterized protein YacL